MSSNVIHFVGNIHSRFVGNIIPNDQQIYVHHGIGRRYDCQINITNWMNKQRYLDGQWYEFLKEKKLRKGNNLQFWFINHG